MIFTAAPSSTVRSVLAVGGVSCAFGWLASCGSGNVDTACRSGLFLHLPSTWLWRITRWVFLQGVEDPRDLTTQCLCLRDQRTMPLPLITRHFEIRQWLTSSDRSLQRSRITQFLGDKVVRLSNHQTQFCSESDQLNDTSVAAKLQNTRGRRLEET